MESESSNKENILEFSKIMKEFISDINNTFSDITNDSIEKNLYMSYINNFDTSKINFDNLDNLHTIDNKFIECNRYLFEYCKKVYPEKFFDILYQNEDIFNQEDPLMFLPDIDFKMLYFNTTSKNTRDTIWKYLQIILFNIITSINSAEALGDNAKLFEAINSDEFKNKIFETMKNMENLFNIDLSNQSQEDISNNMNNFENIFKSFGDIGKNFDGISGEKFANPPNVEEIHDHINNLINGKIGSLAKELAEETTKELDINPEDFQNPNDVFKQMFKNPTKLMGLVSKIGDKLDKKMKDGSIKESELLEEASSIFKNMQNMPGMGNMQDIFKSMNLGDMLPKGGKINPNAFQNMMDQNIKMSKMRERMKRKAQENKNSEKEYSKNYEEEKPNYDSNNLNDINNNLANLMKEFENNTSFIDDLIKKEKNPETNEKRKNKKKGNRKK